MKDCDVLKCLCIYDERHPDFFDYGREKEDKEKPCFCHNCFYGKNDLALEIIKLREHLNLPIQNS